MPAEVPVADRGEVGVKDVDRGEQSLDFVLLLLMQIENLLNGVASVLIIHYVVENLILLQVDLVIG